MPNIFIIHGSYGNPEENWIPRLKKELENLKCNVYTPIFPTPQWQTLQNRRNAFNWYEKYLDNNSVLIWHSTGVLFILDLLERLQTSVNASFLVSWPVWYINIPIFDNLNHTFVTKNFNWDNIKKNSWICRVYHSDNDPYVPFSHCEYICSKLNIKPDIIKWWFHLNKDAWYDKFKKLLRDIEKII